MAPAWQQSRISTFFPGTSSIILRRVSGASASSRSPSLRISTAFSWFSSVHATPWVLRYRKLVSFSPAPRKATRIRSSISSALPGPFTRRVTFVPFGRQSLNSPAIVSALLAEHGVVVSSLTNRSIPTARHLYSMAGASGDGAGRSRAGEEKTVSAASSVRIHPFPIFQRPPAFALISIRKARSGSGFRRCRPPSGCIYPCLPPGRRVQQPLWLRRIRR